MAEKVLSTRGLCRIAMAAVLMSVCAWISIPAPVPFTMQTFGLFCTLELLGGKRGSMAVLLYILLGALGLPVFSGFSGGAARLIGPTGGYIIGYLLAALLYLAAEKGTVNSLPLRILALSGGLAVCYLFGTLWFSLTYGANKGIMSFGSAFSVCVFPFILPDSVKLALAVIVCGRVKKYIK